MKTSKPAPKNLVNRKDGWQGMNWIRQDKRLAIYLRDGMACAYCGATIEKGATLSLDHLQPAAKGGGNHEGNLITCCTACNSRRQDMDLSPWLQLVCGEQHMTVGAWIVSHTALSLAPYRAEAKDIIARRRAGK